MNHGCRMLPHVAAMLDSNVRSLRIKVSIFDSGYKKMIMNDHIQRFRTRKRCNSNSFVLTTHNIQLVANGDATPPTALKKKNRMIIWPFGKLSAPKVAR